MAKTNVERQRAWQKRRNNLIDVKRAKLQAVVDAIMDDVVIKEAVIGSKRTVTVDMAPETRAAIDVIMEAQGTTFAAVMKNSVASWLEWEAKVRALKAKHDAGPSNGESNSAASLPERASRTVGSIARYAVPMA